MAGEQRKVISKIQLPNGQITHIGTDWQDISNKPDLTREQLIGIIEDLYPEASGSEAEEMADDILENYSTVTEDMVEEILESSPGGSLSYAPINSPSFTGIPTAPTASAGTNTTQLATTAFVASAVVSKADLTSPSFSGTPTAPTASVGTSTTQIATTAFVQEAIANIGSVQGVLYGN